MRFQWVSVTGDNGQVLALGSDGELRSSAIAADNFARSTTRFQIRYRYELAPLSNIYLVYSRGGFHLLAWVTTVGSCFLKVGAIAPPRALWLKFATDFNSSTRRLPILEQPLFYRDSGKLEA